MVWEIGFYKKTILSIGVMAWVGPTWLPSSAPGLRGPGKPISRRKTPRIHVQV